MHESACTRIAAAIVLRTLKDTQSKDDDPAASPSDWLTGPESDLYLNVLDLNKGCPGFPVSPTGCPGSRGVLFYLLNATPDITEKAAGELVEALENRKRRCYART